MKTLSTVALIALIAATTTGCMTQNGRMRGGDPGAGSVVAAIDGIADSDRQRQGVTYDLICDKGGKVAGKIAGDYVRFAGEKIADGDLCAMEVRAPTADSKGYEWFGVEANGADAVGLFYGSNKSEVKARKLSLTLYKLYSFNQNDFLAKVEITFAAEAALPDTNKSSGTLVCDDGKSYGGAYSKAPGERDATLSFPLKVTDVKGKTCSKVVVNVDNVATFSGATPDITFVDPKDVAQTFPAAAGTRYTVTAIPTGGDVDVDIVNGGLCLNFEGTVCKDRRTVELPHPKNYVIAKVTGRANGGDGDTVSYFVAAGAAGFGQLEGTTLKVTDLNASLKADANDAEKTRFNWYNDALGANVLLSAFDADFVAGTAFAAHKVERADLAAVVFLHLDAVYVHGFYTLADDALNKQTAAYWFSVVKATKTGSPDVEFIVGGKEKYFQSTSAPITTPATDFFDYGGLISDMTGAGTGNERWRVYALKGGTMSEAACDADKAYYVDAMSARHLGELALPDAKLDACEVLKEHFKADLGTYTDVSTTTYAWGWQVL